MSELNPKDVTKQESKTPEIVRFLRNALNPETKQYKDVQSYLQSYTQVEQELIKVLSGRLPKQIVRMVLKELQDNQEFRDKAFKVILLSTNKEDVLELVKNHFSNKGMELPL